MEREYVENVVWEGRKYMDNSGNQGRRGPLSSKVVVVLFRYNGVLVERWLMYKGKRDFKEYLSWLADKSWC